MSKLPHLGVEEPRHAVRLNPSAAAAAIRVVVRLAFCLAAGEGESAASAGSPAAAAGVERGALEVAAGVGVRRGWMPCGTPW